MQYRRRLRIRHLFYRALPQYALYRFNHGRGCLIYLFLRYADTDGYCDEHHHANGHIDADRDAHANAHADADQYTATATMQCCLRQ